MGAPAAPLQPTPASSPARSAPGPLPVATPEVHLARRSLAGDKVHLSSELRTVAMVWRRELIRFVRARARIVGGLAQPVLFLFVLGYGLSSLVPAAGGIDYKKFMFPGAVAMSVVTTSIFGAISIVWDREFGFLREMLVAPVSRASILLGKTLGSATVATGQGAIMLALAPVLGVRLTPLLVVEALLTMLLTAFALTSFGAFLASRMKKMEGFQVVMGFVLQPMIFLSGAMFPLVNLPVALTILTRLDPLTYGIDPFRRMVLSAQRLTPEQTAAVHARFGGGLTLFGNVVPIWAELLVVAALGGVFLSLAVAAFSKVE
jgi:ABC-2 type transport system permease protein